MGLNHQMKSLMVIGVDKARAVFLSSDAASRPSHLPDPVLKESERGTSPAKFPTLSLMCQQVPPSSSKLI